MGLRRTLENWTVTPISYVASPTHVHQWVLSLFTQVELTEVASAFLFPGILPVLLGLAAFLPASPAGSLRERQRTNPAGALRPARVGVAARVPAAAVLDLAGGLLAARVQLRSRTVALRDPHHAGAGHPAGRGRRALTARARPSRRLAAAAIVGVLLIAESVVAPIPGVPYRVPAPAVERWLDTRPKPFLVAEAPVPRRSNLGRYERFETMAMLHSMAHWQKTVHGYSGIRPPDLEQLYIALGAFPDEASIAALQARKVDYVVVHPALYEPDHWRDVEARLAAARGIRLLARRGRRPRLRG